MALAAGHHLHHIEHSEEHVMSDHIGTAIESLRTFGVTPAPHHAHGVQDDVAPAVLEGLALALLETAAANRAALAAARPLTDIRDRVHWFVPGVDVPNREGQRYRDALGRLWQQFHSDSGWWWSVVDENGEVLMYPNEEDVMYPHGCEDLADAGEDAFPMWRIR